MLLVNLNYYLWLHWAARGTFQALRKALAVLQVSLLQDRQTGEAPRGEVAAMLTHQHCAG